MGIPPASLFYKHQRFWCLADEKVLGADDEKALGADDEKAIAPPLVPFVAVVQQHTKTAEEWRCSLSPFLSLNVDIGLPKDDFAGIE